jgi:hypothetical protein
MLDQVARMNDRNISALVQMLRGAPGLPAGIPLEALAEHLAASGFLYPAATVKAEWTRIDVLTSADCGRLP